jgi:hypothetical protein
MDDRAGARNFAYLRAASPLLSYRALDRRFPVLRLLRLGLLLVVPFVTVGALAGCEDDSTSPPTDMAATAPQDLAKATTD